MASLKSVSVPRASQKCGRSSAKSGRSREFVWYTMLHGTVKTRFYLGSLPAEFVVGVQKVDSSNDEEFGTGHRD